ncbi:MAG: response regulator [Chloroflexota bacterium]
MRTVMIVEDDDLLNEVMAELIRLSGFHVLALHTCAQAIATLEKTVPDAVICDLTLPDGNGVMVLQALRATQVQQVPFIMTSGRTELELAGYDFMADVDTFLPKPFESAQLNHLLRTLVSGGKPDHDPHIDHG